jgi:hypothetical protein
MEIKLTIGFEQLLSLAKQLPEAEKKELVEALQENTSLGKSKKGERQLGKYEGQIWMSDDFNHPLEEFKDYM